MGIAGADINSAGILRMDRHGAGARCPLRKTGGDFANELKIGHGLPICPAIFRSPKTAFGCGHKQRVCIVRINRDRIGLATDHVIINERRAERSDGDPLFGEGLDVRRAGCSDQRNREFGKPG